jgi:hypothetical protein
MWLLLGRRLRVVESRPSNVRCAERGKVDVSFRRQGTGVYKIKKRAGPAAAAADSFCWPSTSESVWKGPDRGDQSRTDLHIQVEREREREITSSVLLKSCFSIASLLASVFLKA